MSQIAAMAEFCENTLNNKGEFMADAKQIKDAGDVAHSAASQGCQTHPQKGFAFTDLDTGIQFSGAGASCSEPAALRNENIDLALKAAVESCRGIPKQTGVASVGDPAVQVSVPCLAAGQGISR